MNKKHKNFSQLVTDQFKDIEFAKIYLLNLINHEGYTIEDALKHTIKEIGVTSFSKNSQFSKKEIEQYLKGMECGRYSGTEPSKLTL